MSDNEHHENDEVVIPRLSPLPTYCMTTFEHVHDCSHCWEQRDKLTPVIAFFRKLFCWHVYSPGDTYKGYEIDPQTVGYPALKQHIRCAKCNKHKVVTLCLL